VLSSQQAVSLLAKSRFEKSRGKDSLDAHRPNASAGASTFIKLIWKCCAATALLGSLYALEKSLPRPFREYPGDEYVDFQKPFGWQHTAEWVFARLMYPSVHGGGYYNRRWGRGGGDWTKGYTSWTNDYPRADRHFSEALGRLTRIDVRPVEQPVNLTDGSDVYNWPWLYAVQTGQWNLTEQQAAKLRDYLARGGFLMCDDFWGPREWENFEISMKRVFPDRPIVEIDNTDAIFHTVYDLDDRYQVSGEWSLHSGLPYRNGGADEHWRGIYDEKNRLVVAICFNSDVGDSWEWADEPEYPEHYSALGIRIGVDYVVYAMTH
jgi:hypothetical protein